MIRRLNGKTPKIAASAFISEAAYIVGDVEIGEDSSVWPGAVIRGDFGSIKVGKNSCIEDNCILHSARHSLVIGNNVRIGHGAAVNCRIIGNEVLIGMNSTILHEAEIGNQCIIGANCLVMQGMKIPDKSFVTGVPGKVKQEASPEQLLWITKGSDAYTALAREYKEQGL